MAQPTRTEMLTHLEGFAKLEDNWDGYGALPTNAGKLEAARRFLTGWPDALEMPWPVPDTNGGVTLEWDHGRNGLLIGFDPEPSATVTYVWDEDADVETEGPLADHRDLTMRAMQALPKADTPQSQAPDISELLQALLADAVKSANTENAPQANSASGST